ncbi:transglutaminase domain-containing protein [Marinobacterium aestuariivivens]|uniref:Transglutaminase domain-containing protein n=1 Tax=Marinobacterium aestuariivivens TaxID=1698799 RepID=A0ABW2A051_9GAMM
MAAARAIERYLVETFPTPPPGAPPAERDLTKALFDSGRLTEGQRLSAFALMLRCLDTPTRMVEGYRSNLRHPLSGQIEVTTDHGIVWPEVWQARHGWIAFAVTDRPDPLGEPGWLENAERFLLLRLRLAETGPLERLALETALVLVRLLLELKLLLASHPLPAALAGLLVLLLLGLAWLFRRRIGDGLQDWQLRRRLRHDPERAALHLYAALERWLHRRRLPRDRHETASEYGRRLGDGEPALRAALIPVLKAFNDCRYGPPGHSALAPDEALLHWRRIRRLADEIDWL